jgi:hypothetical protein
VCLSNLKRNLQAHVFSRSIFEQMGEEERNARDLNDRKIFGSLLEGDETMR